MLIPWHCRSTSTVCIMIFPTIPTAPTPPTWRHNGGGDRSTPYYGVAPEADIFASTSILHDVGILAGVEDIIAYTRQRGRPAVINLSLGSKIGPHDGTDAFCRYLDLCAADDAAILLAAGNNGDMHVSVSKSFSDADSVLSMRLRSTFWDDVTVYNAFTDVWSSDSRPLRMRLRAWDKINEETAFTTAWINFIDKEIWQISSESNPEFSRFYDGEIKAAAEVNPPTAVITFPYLSAYTAARCCPTIPGAVIP